MGKAPNKHVAKERHKKKAEQQKGNNNGFPFNLKLNLLLPVAFLALLFGYLHSQHVAGMFERQRFFSHLSTLERELSFRTEMGLYYSYYKTIAEAPSFMNGLSKIIQCNITEYPDKVNVLRRFNLYPEVVLGAMFRMFRSYTETNRIKTQDCYTITRGSGMSSVQSCVGMGDIAHFYVYPIFWLNGFMISILFILGHYISGNVLGGIIVVAQYFYNHGEATRVMWTPPLRESFSFPFLIAQMLTVSYMIKCCQPNQWHSLFLAAVTTCFMLPWQFAQFALLTQVCALFGLYMLKFIDSKRMVILLHGLLLSHVLNFVAQFGNTLLISSFFMAAMIAALVIVKLEDVLEKLPHRIIIWITQAFMFVFLSIGIKTGFAKLFHIKDDAHIFDILRSKFTDYKNFHTLLYVCAPEFDFIGWEYPQKLTMTLLIPSAAVVTLVLFVKILWNEWRYWIRGESLIGRESPEDSLEDSPTKPFAVELYMMLQTAAFVIISIMIMRLKLFATPALCILSCLLASRDVFGFVGKKLHHHSIVIIILAIMSVQGYKNLKTELNMKGEYNNPALENLVEWVNANANKNDVFAGAMPTMAAIKLSCERPIVNHPHYEDSGLRARTKRIYQMYSRKQCSFVHKEVKEMGVNYFIMELSWCNRRTREGCALPEVWDVENPGNRGKPPCCSLIPNHPAPFKIVYHDDNYFILKV